MKSTQNAEDAAREIAENAVLDCCENEELAHYILEEFALQFKPEVETLDEAEAAYKHAQGIANYVVETSTDTSPKTYALPRECNGHKEW